MAWTWIRSTEATYLCSCLCPSFLFLFCCSSWDCIGASRCLVTPKLGRQQQQCQGESGVERKSLQIDFSLLAAFIWPFDNHLNNFVSLNYFVNFQAFCKYLPFSLQRQIPVYSPFVICCPRSVDVTFPSSLSFLLLYLFYFSTFSSSSHPFH